MPAISEAYILRSTAHVYRTLPQCDDDPTGGSLQLVRLKRLPQRHAARATRGGARGARGARRGLGARARFRACTCTFPRLFLKRKPRCRPSFSRVLRRGQNFCAWAAPTLLSHAGEDREQGSGFTSDTIACSSQYGLGIFHCLVDAHLVSHSTSVGKASGGRCYGQCGEVEFAPARQRVLSGRFKGGPSEPKGCAPPQPVRRGGAAVPFTRPLAPCPAYLINAGPPAYPVYAGACSTRFRQFTRYTQWRIPAAFQLHQALT
jgi:hypothetical protein